MGVENEVIFIHSFEYLFNCFLFICIIYSSFFLLGCLLCMDVFLVVCLEGSVY